MESLKLTAFLFFVKYLLATVHQKTKIWSQVAPYKEALSDSMRARLMKEASSGLDSEQKNPNTILYVSAAIAVLVVLGGKGILY